MTEPSPQSTEPQPGSGEAGVAPAWAWREPDGTAPDAAEAPPAPAVPDPGREDEMEALRRQLAAALERGRRAEAEAVEARRLLDEVRSQAEARCAALEQRADAALLQARADAQALDAVALAARATERRASLLAEELATLRAARRRPWGRG
jgi:hypothetical protein